MENFKTAITANFMSRFPNGWIKVSLGKGFCKGLIFIKYGLIGNVHDQYAHIQDNDPMYSGFTLKPTSTGYTIVKNRSGIDINPPENSFLAMGRIKTPFNKKHGTLLKITEMLIKHFKLQAATVLANQDSIYNRKCYPDIYFTTIK